MATIYIVLRQRDGGPKKDGALPVLELLGTAEAETPRQAYRAFAEGEDGPVIPGAYVAVPTRNWTEEEIEEVSEIRYRARTIPGGGAYELTHVPLPQIPGQTSIEEAEELAQQIGDPEFGPEEEEPFDPANLGGQAESGSGGSQKPPTRTAVATEDEDPDDAEGPEKAA